ncbi:unnamed protein product [Leuciscus chuanchicus]
MLSLLERAENVLLQLRDSSGRHLHAGPRKTGPIGFVASSRSISNIFKELVEAQDAPCKYLLTYKLSQDHLELFFSAVRARGGYNNNNPTAQQFKAAYKRLLVRHQVKNGTGNRLIRDGTNMLAVTVGPASRQFDVTPALPLDSDHDYSISPYVDSISEFKDAAIHYIAGYVVKKMPCSVALSSDPPGNPEPLLTEVALLMMMRQEPISPFVIRLYEWFEDPRDFTLVMEYPEPCESLLDFITRNHQVFETTARVIMRQAVLAVQHCIHRGVFHNDIHAQNFLLKKPPLQLKLIDFGCGQLFSSDGYDSKIYIGVPNYCPPEVLTEPRFHAVPANVWSLGVLLYQMVNGCSPFHNRTEITQAKVTFLKPNLSKTEETTRRLGRDDATPGKRRRDAWEETTPRLGRDDATPGKRRRHAWEETTRRLGRDDATPGKRRRHAWEETTPRLGRDDATPGKRRLDAWEETTPRLGRDDSTPGKRRRGAWEETTPRLGRDDAHAWEETTPRLGRDDETPGKRRRDAGDMLRPKLIHD